MRIILGGSMRFSDKMIEVKQELEKLGHDVITCGLIDNYRGKEEKAVLDQKLKDRSELSATKKFWGRMVDREAILILNFDKNGIKNYIGGNALMDMAFAHLLNQKIFLWNPIPDIPYYKEEMISFNPVIIHGDITKIK